MKNAILQSRRWELGLALFLGVLLRGELMAQQFARPDGTVSAGAWSAVGAGTLHDAVNEVTASDAEYMDSGSNSTTAELSLSNVADPADDSNHFVRLRAQSTAKQSDPRTFQVQLYEGGQAGTEIWNSGLLTATRNVFGDHNFTLTLGQAGAITDYNDLQFVITSVSGDPIQVSWIELEVPEFTAVAPTLSGSSASSITATSADLEATITSDGGSPLTGRGTLWNDVGPPITQNQATEGGTGIGFFSHTRSPLPPATRIWFRAYAENIAGISYSEDASFYTEPDVQATGVSFSGLSETGMTIQWTPGTGAGSIVIVKENAAVDAPPVDGSEHSASSVFMSGEELGTGNYVVFRGSGSSVAVTNLTPGKTYHVAVHMYSGSGTGPSGVNYLQTTPATGSQLIVGPPSLSNSLLVNAEDASAEFGATIDGDGGAAITERGTLWNTTGAPVLENQLAEGGTTTGLFTDVRSGLPAGTLVHFRAYAVNSFGTSYSPDASFFTEPAAQASSVLFSDVTDSSMQVNWTPSGDGSIVVVKDGAAVDELPLDGVEHLAVATFGSGEDLGTGNFVVYRGAGSSVPVTGLVPGHTYHVAVYAYSGTGSGQSGLNYREDTPATGSQLIVGAATVTTPTVTNATDSAATLGATVANDGGGALIERGTVWNTTGAPIVENPLAEGGTTVEPYSHLRAGLPSSSRVYFRGYAVNSFGTAYSPDSYFFTEPSQASAVVFSEVDFDVMRVSWTPGDGDGSIVVVKEGGAVDAAPVDGTIYAGDVWFGDGEDLGGSNFVAYAGTEITTVIWGLQPATTYHVAVYEYKGSGTGQSGINYRQNGPATGSQQSADPPFGHNYDNAVTCQQCHFSHATIPRDTDQITACVDQCHNPSGPAASMSDVGLHIVNSGTTTIDCGSCHEVHRGDSALAAITTTDTHAGGITAPNQSLVRGNVTKYVATAQEPALFHGPPDVPDSAPFLAFADGNTPYNGICQSCHTSTSHHTNDSGSGDHTHPAEISGSAGKICTDCHLHSGGFAPTVDPNQSCRDTACHGGTNLGRREIVSEFSLTSHHVMGGAVTDDDCGVCHYEAAEPTAHINGVIDLLDPDLGTPLTGFTSLTRNRADPNLEATVVDVQNNFCLKCHDGDGAVATNFSGNALRPFSADGGRDVPNVFAQFDPTHDQYHPVRAPANNPHCDSQTMLVFNQTGHDLISCFDCHETNGHGATFQRMIIEDINFDALEVAVDKAGATAAASQTQIENLCTRCHDRLVYLDDRNPHTLGSAFAFHGRGQAGHSSNNDAACLGCHGGIGDMAGKPYWNGAARGNIHGTSFQWPAGTAWAETANQWTTNFMVGGFISEYWADTTNQLIYCGGGTCNHAGGRNEARY